MRLYRGSRGSAPLILNLIYNAGARYVGGWVGLRTGLGDVWRRETHLPLPGFETRADSSERSSYTDEAILALTRRVQATRPHGVIKQRVTFFGFQNVRDTNFYHI
jgi:hypothetical protein